MCDRIHSDKTSLSCGLYLQTWISVWVTWFCVQHKLPIYFSRTLKCSSVAWVYIFYVLKCSSCKTTHRNSRPQTHLKHWCGGCVTRGPSVHRGKYALCFLVYLKPCWGNSNHNPVVDHSVVWRCKPLCFGIIFFFTVNIKLVWGIFLYKVTHYVWVILTSVRKIWLWSKDLN